MIERKIASEMTSSSQRAILGSIAASIAFVMELTLVPLLLPAIHSQFELSISQIAWVFNSYGIAVAFGVLFGGWLGDRFGIRRLFGVGVVLFALGAVAVASAGSLETIIVGRVIQGFGGGVFSPLVPLLLTRALPHRPGKVLIIWGSVTGYVAAFAPLVFSHGVNEFGWQLAFGVFALISVVALLTVAKSNAGDATQAVDAPPKYRRLFQSRELWLIFVYVFCTYGAITFYLFRLPLWLAENDYKVVSIGFILFAIWFSFSIVSTLLRNLVDSPRVRGILLIAPLLIAAGFPVATLSGGMLTFAFSALLVGTGLACSNAPSTQMILKFAPIGMSAVSTSLDITFARLGGVATVAVLAQMPFEKSILAILVMSLVAVLCALGCVRKPKHIF
ncbi:MAG: MFS transporter [Pseudomonadota bacterium]